MYSRITTRYNYAKQDESNNYDDFHIWIDKFSRAMASRNVISSPWHTSRPLRNSKIGQETSIVDDKGTRDGEINRQFPNP